MVSLIQNILTKNQKTICQVILVKTSQKMIMNLLMMVMIDLPIIKFTCQHHVSGYVRHVRHLGFFFLLLIEIISIAKLWIIAHFFVLKHKKQTLTYIHTKFEGDRNTNFFSPIYFVGAPVFLPQHWKLLGPERLMPLKLLGMNRAKSYTTEVWSKHQGTCLLRVLEVEEQISKTSNHLRKTRMVWWHLQSDPGVS